MLQQISDTDESMETTSNPVSPLRASTPVTENEDDGIYLEDTLPWETSFEVSKEEDERQETSLEASWRMEAEMIDSRAKELLRASWQEARDLKRRAAMEAKQYRTAATYLLKNADTKKDLP